MAGFSDFLENEILDHVFGAAEYTAPATLYAALFTTAPNDNGTGGTEVSGNNYSRVAITNDGTILEAAVSNIVDNASQISFPTPSESWGTVVAFGLYDASTSGNLLAFANLDNSKTIGLDDTVLFDTGDFNIQLTGFSNFLNAEILDHVFAGASYTAPATIYVELFTAAPNFSTGAGGTVVSGGSYARASITNNSTNFPAASAGAKSNGTAVSFTTPTANWGTVTSFGYYDASSGGNFLGGATLASSRIIETDDTVEFAIGDLDITLD